MTAPLNERMQFLLDCLTADRVRPKDRFRYIKTKEFKAKCRVYKYRISERDIKTLYKLNCFPPLQSETEPEVAANTATTVSSTYKVCTDKPIITTYHVLERIEPPAQRIGVPAQMPEPEIEPEAPLVNTYKVNEDTSESTSEKSIEFFPNIYTLCAIYLTIITTMLYTIYVVFVNDFK